MWLGNFSVERWRKWFAIQRHDIHIFHVTRCAGIITRPYILQLHIEYEMHCILPPIDSKDARRIVEEYDGLVW